jgi:translation initiation factor 4G
MSVICKEWTQRMDGIREVYELEKAALVQEHRSEIDSMTRRLRGAEQRRLDELHRLQMDPKSVQANFHPQGIDPRAMPMPMQIAPNMYPQMQKMQYIPPQPPNQPGYQPSAYIPGQYAPQTQPISRNSSPISEQRPAVIIGQPPSMTRRALPSQTLTQHYAPPSARPARKRPSVVITWPDSIKIESFKAPTPPTPSAQARPPPAVTSTPTPPPKSSTQHA